MIPSIHPCPCSIVCSRLYIGWVLRLTVMTILPCINTTTIATLFRVIFVYVYEPSCPLFRSSSYISSVCCRDFDLLILYTELYMHPQYPLLVLDFLISTDVCTFCHIFYCLISHIYIYTCQSTYYHVSA